MVLSVSLLKGVEQMRLTVDTGRKVDLSAEDMAKLDAFLRKAIPTLIGWSYSPLTGELTLNFGESDDNAMLAKINDYTTKVNAKRVLRFEFMDMIKEWTT
jgi:hypothetical protein